MKRYGALILLLLIALLLAAGCTQPLPATVPMPVPGTVHYRILPGRVGLSQPCH